VIATKVKVITSHVGRSRWLATVEEAGFIPRGQFYDSYASGPTKQVLRGRDGRLYVCCEVSHRRYQVYRLNEEGEFFVFATDAGAETYAKVMRAERTTFGEVRVGGFFVFAGLYDSPAMAPAIKLTPDGLLGHPAAGHGGGAHRRAVPRPARGLHNQGQPPRGSECPMTNVAFYWHRSRTREQRLAGQKLQVLARATVACANDENAEDLLTRTLDGGPHQRPCRGALRRRRVPPPHHR
jgi:hypothetical protein